MPSSILTTIGDTPLVDLSSLVPEGGGRLFAKLESANPTGSMKDRMALAMIEAAERDGRLVPGQAVVEYTGGSTGMSLGMVCAVKGHPLHIVTNDGVSEEKRASMAAFGADLLVLETPEQRMYPGLIDRMREEVDRIVATSGAFWTAQMENPDQLDGYERMAHEILEQCPEITDFVKCVGTAGCAMGNARVLKPERNVHVTIVEPAESPWLSKGEGGSHRVEGTAALARPPLLDDALWDDVIALPEADGRAMCRRLARERGVFAGTSSGMNVAAAIKVAKARGPVACVVTVLVDSGMKYLGQGLFSEGS